MASLLANHPHDKHLRLPGFFAGPGWKKPQEDEFALMAMGARSPYRRIAFPNDGPSIWKCSTYGTFLRRTLPNWTAPL